MARHAVTRFAVALVSGVAGFVVGGVGTWMLTAPVLGVWAILPALVVGIGGFYVVANLVVLLLVASLFGGDD